MPLPLQNKDGGGLTVRGEWLVDGIDVLVKNSYGASVEAGWHSDPDTGQPKERNVGEMLCLIHSEISEAMEGYRKSKMDDHLPHLRSIEVELADALIRIGDLAGYLKLDLGRAIIEKMAYNTQRADHKIENRKLSDGKKF